MKKPVFIVGFMASGKTTFGKKLASKLGLPFKDLDKMIEAASGNSISQLFEEKGEQYFREMESRMLRSMPEEAFVLATGGGTPCFDNNIEWMNKRGITLYLRLPPGAVYQRLSALQKQDRPLIKDLEGEQLLQFVEDKLLYREPFYLKAELVVDALRADMNEITASIIEKQGKLSF